jgi:uncharacterized protein (DUF58 family)
LKARIADHFNIFVDNQELLEKEHLSVFPRISGLKAFNFKSKKNIHFPGEFLTSQAGASTEFYNIRNYQKGDPFKKINWKVFARKRELMVNEYEKENICDTILFLDARSISNIGSVTMNALETNVKLALAISNFLILHRNQVGMVMYNDRVKVLPPKAGLRQRNEILRFLTGVYAKSWTGFNVALDYAKPYIKAKTTLIIFSNLDYDHTLYKSIQEQIAFNNRVIIISPSSLEFELKTAEYSGPFERVNLFRMSRQNFIDELRDLGALIIQYAPDDALEEIIEKVSLTILR